MTPTLDLFRSQLKLYGEQPDSWKAASDDAALAFELEQALAYGIFLFDRVCRVDEDIQERFLTGKLAYEPAWEGRIQEHFKEWSRVTDHCLAVLKQLEDKGYEFEQAEEFRRCCREVRGILTPDNQFFVGEALVDLRDKAVDEHRAGQTTEMRRMGD